MDRPDWVSPEIDIERPSAARMYDYYLGGSHNFAADRQAAEALVAAVPDVTVGVKANRAFLLISHGSAVVRPSQAKVGADVYRTTATPLSLRGPAQVAAFFAGLELVEPGIVWAPQWHPDSPAEVGGQPGDTGMVTGVAVEPGRRAP